MDPQKIKNMRFLLSLHFAFIAILTAMLVSYGSGSVFLPLFITLISITSLVVVDKLEWFALDRIGIFIGMTLGTGIAIGGYIYNTVYVPSESGQLHAVAGLLVYPEAVLFWQRKNLRVFEQLAIFLLLEIMVAALVNDNIFFGLLLIPIVLMWVSSLMLFSTYATLVQISPNIEVAMPKVAELLFAKLRKSILGPENKKTILVSKLLVTSSAETTAKNQRVPQSLTLGVGAIVFAAMFFYLLPRTTTGGYRPRLGEQIRVGLPEDLKFGHVGRALLDPTPVLRIKLTTGKDRKIYKLKEAPYIRARVYDRYSREPYIDSTMSAWYGPQGRLWHQSIPEFDTLNADAVEGRDRVDVEFDLLPSANVDTFTMPPSCLPMSGRAPDGRLQPYTQLLRVDHDDEDPEERHNKAYRLGSMGFVNGRQLDISPILSVGDEEALSRVMSQHLSSLQYVNNAAIPTVDSLRARILKESKVPEDNPLLVAKAIEDFFISGREYSYTLDISHTDKFLDPIEDFVVNQKAGHCQYFAATMVLMLRQCGIPARVVVGYHPHQSNALGGYLAVQQKDCHAWVEARFRASELKGTSYEKWTIPGSDYWIRFDPTPDVTDDLVDQPNGLKDYAEKLWKGYVLEGRELTGEDSVYAPVSRGSNEAYKELALRWQRWKDSLTSGEFGAGAGTIGFAWPLAMLVFFVGGSIVAIWQLIRSLPRFAPRLATRLGLRERQADFKQEFFSRCVKMLKKFGFERRISQTPQEITHQAANFLSSEKGLPASRDWLQLLTQKYYQMRFGNTEALSESEQQEIQAALKSLEKNLSKIKR
jgi:protein-glutamine gamma-glutamyltransferase